MTGGESVSERGQGVEVRRFFSGSGRLGGLLVDDRATAAGLGGG